MAAIISVQDLSGYRDVPLETCDEIARPITSVPSEIWENVFSFLNFKDQAHVEQTCRTFRGVIARAPQLRLHKVRDLRRLAQSIPTLQTLQANIFDLFFMKLGPSSTYALCSAGISLPSRLIVANKKTGIAHEIDIKKIGDPSFETILFAQEISPHTIIIVSSTGNISWWRHGSPDVQDSQPWHCEGEQRLDLPPSKAISKICVDRESLYIWYPDIPLSGHFLDVFDFPSKKMKGRYHFQDEPHSNLDYVSSGIIYKSIPSRKENTSILQAVRLCDRATEVLWETEGPANAFFLIIGANSQWIAVKDINIYSWTILDAKTGEIYWHYTDLPQQQGLREESIRHWTLNAGPFQLYNDFLLCRAGNEVRIWDIPTQRCCATLDIHQLQPMVLPFEMPSIAKIALVDDELLICYFNKNGFVQVSQFSSTGTPNDALSMKDPDSRLISLIHAAKRIAISVFNCFIPKVLQT